MVQHMESDESTPDGVLNTAWERRVLRSARGLSLMAFVILVLFGVVLTPGGAAPWLAALIAGVAALGLHALMTRKLRHRRQILSQPFPAEWEAVLMRDVVFYRTLEPADRVRFRREIQVFLGEKRVTGIKVALDTTTRVLTAASAVIPIFGFPEWEWDQISEVLIYPARFDQEFTFGKGGGHRTLGMVGTGAMNRLMILSKPDLIGGFRNPGDKRNVGVHEFAHLVDKTDGTIDGVPGTSLTRHAVRPWLELVRRKSEEIESGDSDIDRYALTNEAEFFAVTSEYFFERPGVMKRKHPELYAALAGVFNQDLGARVRSMAKEIKTGRRSFGRNSRCPCGSGKKYKKCCLSKS